MEFFLGLLSLFAIQSFVMLVFAVISGETEFALGIVAIYAIVWVIYKHHKTKLEKAKLEAEQKAEQKARLEAERKAQLKNSLKFCKLGELFEALKPYREPIVLRLNTSAEFNKYDKMVALGVAYDEIFSKYKFFNDNHFSDILKNILAISENASEYVREREEVLVKSITNTIQTPVQVIWTYTSPAGRNTRTDSAYITFEELQEYERNQKTYQSSINAAQYRRERERQMMTQSLRYDILKRDNFRCQICGRTAQDGVMLEVDHKIPIAKGGKTEPNNLWTLCRDCNRGKAAKYEEDDYDEDD